MTRRRRSNLSQPLNVTALPWDGDTATLSVASAHTTKSTTPASGSLLSLLQAHGFALNDQDIERTKYGAALAEMLCIPMYRATVVRSSTVGATPWAIKERSSGTVIASSKDADPPNELARAILLVGRREGEPFFKLWQHALCVTGMNFIEKVPREGFFPPELDWLNPIVVSLDILNGSIRGYRYSPRGGSEYYEAREIVYSRYRYLKDDFYGYSPAQVAMDNINLDRNDKRSLLAHFRNNARPDMSISPVRTSGSVEDDQFSDHEMARIRAMLEQQRGVDNQGKYAVFPYPVQVDTYGQQELEKLVELMDYIKVEVYEAYGTPPAIAGNPDTSRYQVSPEQVKVFNRTVLNELVTAEETVNEQIVPHFDPRRSYYLEFDKAQYVTLTESELERRKLAGEDYDGGRITLNSYLKKTNQPTVPDGNVYKLLAGSIFVPEGQLGQMQPMSPLMQPGSLLGTPSPFNAAQPPAQDEPYSTDSFCVMLKFGAQPALVDLQDKLRQAYAGSSIEWNEPDDFHVTLLYVPRIDDAQVDALMETLQSISVPEMTLRIGSVATFDNVGSHALHFRVRRDADLLELQESLYGAAVECECQCSPYSQPALYKPHVTMGYSDAKVPRITFHGSATMQPTALVIARGDETLLERTIGEVITLPSKPAPAAEQDDAESELRAWQKKTANSFQRAAAGFEVKHLPYSIHAFVLDGLRASNGDKAAVRAVFQRAAELLREDADECKAVADVWQALRVLGKSWIDTYHAFHDELLRIIGAAQADEVKRGRFAADMRAALRRYGLQAFRDGMNETGHDPESFSPKELSVFRRWQEEQSGYVTNFGAEIFRQGITEAEIAIRARMWSDISLRAIYLQGVAAGDGEKRYKWLWRAGSDHCVQCRQLNGQVHTISEFLERGLFPGCNLLDCGPGCNCGLEPTNDDVKGSFLG